MDNKRKRKIFRGDGKFHNYAIVSKKGKITMYLDGKLFNGSIDFWKKG